MAGDEGVAGERSGQDLIRGSDQGAIRERSSGAIIRAGFD